MPRKIATCCIMLSTVSACIFRFVAIFRSVFRSTICNGELGTRDVIVVYIGILVNNGLHRRMNRDWMQSFSGLRYGGSKRHMVTKLTGRRDVDKSCVLVVIWSWGSWRSTIRSLSYAWTRERRKGTGQFE